WTRRGGPKPVTEAVLLATRVRPQYPQEWRFRAIPFSIGSEPGTDVTLSQSAAIGTFRFARSKPLVVDPTPQILQPSRQMAGTRRGGGGASGGGAARGSGAARSCRGGGGARPRRGSTPRPRRCSTRRGTT